MFGRTKKWIHRIARNAAKEAILEALNESIASECKKIEDAKRSSSSYMEQLNISNRLIGQNTKWEKLAKRLLESTNQPEGEWSHNMNLQNFEKAVQQSEKANKIEEDHV